MNEKILNSIKLITELVANSDLESSTVKTIKIFSYEKTVWLGQQNVWLLSSQKKICFFSQQNFDCFNKKFLESTKLVWLVQ